MAKRRLTNAALILIFFVGLALLLYPSFSNWYNVRHASHMIASYLDEVADLNEDRYTQMMLDAQSYSQKLLNYHNYALTPELEAEYNSVLDIAGVGVMGYVDIPKLSVSLPIYHGTSEDVLQIAVGHLDWTTLPIGGVGTHCVLSGHRGLPSAKLFTDLPDLALGDVFYLRVLNEVLTYEVDQILTVEPDDVDALHPVPGKDYCTLITCTPYGINTHRILVRGHRISNENDVAVAVTADAVRVETFLVAPFIAMPILLILLCIVLFGRRRKHPEIE